MEYVLVSLLAVLALGIVSGIAAQCAPRRGGQRLMRNAPPLKVQNDIPKPPPRR